MLFSAHEYLRRELDPKILHKYAQLLKTGILLDTNPLFIYLIGPYDKLHGTNFLYADLKHTEEDYDALITFMNAFSQLGYNFYVTPHVFTEVTKHIQKSLPCNKHQEVIKFCTRKFEGIKEEYCEEMSAPNILKQSLFRKGVLEAADISLLHHKEHKAILIKNPTFVRTQDTEDILVLDFDDLKAAYTDRKQASQ